MEAEKSGIVTQQQVGGSVFIFAYECIKIRLECILSHTGKDESTLRDK